MGTNNLSIINPNTNLLIAPCGMNCTLCYAYQRNKNKCPGCRIDASKPISRVICKIKTCKFFGDDENSFCYQCESFPCKNLKKLDKRYRNKYYMSMVDNLEYIRKNGLKKFIRSENIRWACKSCGGSICVHKGACINCSS